MCKILTKYLIGGDKRTSYAEDTITTKQNYQTEKMKKKKNSAQCNRYKVKRRSRLDIDKNVRLERKGTFIAQNIEVKVNKKK